MPLQTTTANSRKKCSRCKAAGKKPQHTGGTATCKDRAVCTTCSKAYGTLDAKHHVGGMEIRDMVEPTTKKAGHTGNSYCKGCNTKLSDGTVIPVISNLSTGKKSDLATALKAMEKFLNSHGSHGIPEAIAIAVFVLLHPWKRQMLLSIAGGTICYILLVQLVF